MTLNLYSVALLTSAFLQHFKEGERCLLNITSLAASVAFKGMAFYCVGKASREMYFKALAVEDPSLNILSYSPGNFFNLKTFSLCLNAHSNSVLRSNKNRYAGTNCERVLQCGNKNCFHRYDKQRYLRQDGRHYSKSNRRIGTKELHKSGPYWFLRSTIIIYLL